MTNKIRLAALKIIDPHALDRPILASLLEDQARIANDPAIQDCVSVRSRPKCEPSCDQPSSGESRLAFLCSLA